jgi:DMSO/TMAO reductase YedYZ molybdopterin-dependent catalytic subunit
VRRRQFLTAATAPWLLAAIEPLLGLAQLQPPPGGRLVRTMPLGRFDGEPVPPLGKLIGTGLDARLFTDHSALGPESLITPTDRFYVRTAATSEMSRSGPWTINLGGRVQRASTVPVSELIAQAQATGVHLMECSGNTDPANFGLLSAAEWTGVRMTTLLERVMPNRGVSLVRITGLDDDSRRWQTSVAGASWIFAWEDLAKTGAFLATGMNGAPLTPDHGFPVRLVVPNWYGCVCIKWVTAIDMVPDDTIATPHMREFAERTHQDSTPGRAREFQPAVIDLAAMPVRVEQWRTDAGLLYRIVGVRWGGSAPTRALTIRFRHDERFVRVEDSPAPPSATTWGLWSHTWQPKAPGRYQIALSVADPTVRARRLDVYFYTREVEINET